MLRVAFVGARGLTGSIARGFMQENGDFDRMEVNAFYTSEDGRNALKGGPFADLLPGDDIKALARHDVVFAAQGSDYSKKIRRPLLEEGFDGHMIDFSSAFRMERSATLTLQPINQGQIDQQFDNGCKLWAGPNCTTSVGMIGIGGLLRAGLVGRLRVTSYQAVSGIGAQGIPDLVAESDQVTEIACGNGGRTPLQQAAAVTAWQTSDGPFKDSFGVPMAFNILPWIDSDNGNGRSREEQKFGDEMSKILGLSPGIPVSATCVRVPTLVCHSMDLDVELTRGADLEELEALIAGDNDFVRVIPNGREDTLKGLTPRNFAGTPFIGVGRMRRSFADDPRFFRCFVIGDQTQWGAAIPPYRMLRYLEERLA